MCYPPAMYWGLTCVQNTIPMMLRVLGMPRGLPWDSATDVGLQDYWGVGDAVTERQRLLRPKWQLEEGERAGLEETEEAGEEEDRADGETA